MRKFITIVLLLAFAVVGCNVQRGHFITTGSRATALAEVGLIEIVEGYSNDNDAVSQDLVYVLVVCSDGKVHGSGSSIDIGKYVTSLNYSWDAETGGISAQVQWDRGSDTVLIGENKYGREQGNVFVVRREPDGKMVGQQLPGLGTHAAFPEVLRHIQQHLTNDQLIASLKLNK